jgi:hypothetical protein
MLSGCGGYENQNIDTKDIKNGKLLIPPCLDGGIENK